MYGHAWVDVRDVLLDAVEEPLAGDCDGDWDIDVDDWFYIGTTNCMTGPTLPAAPECGCADLDHDTDADLADIALLQDVSTAGR